MSWRVDEYLREYEAVQAYLRISRVYSAYLDGLRWSSTEDALVNADGRFFAFTEAIAEFLEGFDSGGRVLPFSFLLHWMDLLQNQRSLDAPEIRRLRALFYETGGNWRCAGAFCASLPCDVPEVPNPPELSNVARRLRNRAFPIRWFTSQFHETSHPPAMPPVAPSVFEACAIQSLSKFDDEDLRTWLRTGRGPTRDAERLVQMPPEPLSLSQLLAQLLERPRLAGAQTYVTQLIGALALPPRRFTPDELPVGGYSDIVTRGEPEHLLPAQFALDEVEFLRRYAEKELLYFRREEPPVQNRQELVVLLDQGVRTWGDVRLVLAAAAIAYGKHAIARKTPFHVATTCNHGRIVDPATLDGETLGTLVEASDLSLHPASAIEAVLQTPCEAQRDIVLLTNPRSLREADVLTASRCVRSGDRLFAAALDRHGAATLSELRRGAVLKVREFRVEFVSSQPAPRRQSSDDTPGGLWSGDVEAIPFPFRLGTEPNVTHFDFDYDSRWLFTASGQGVLHLWRLDGSGMEMLPRPCTDRVLKQVVGMIGVAGGFVVAEQKDRELLLAHYDVVRRSCRVYSFGEQTWSWPQLILHYDFQRHRVIVVGVYRRTLAVNLSEGEVETIPLGTSVASLRTESEHALRNGFLLGHNRSLLRNTRTTEHSEHASFCEINQTSGDVHLQIACDGRRELHTFQPIADGKPCFIDAQSLHDAQLGGNTLAITMRRKDIGESITLIELTDHAIVREESLRRPKRLRHRLSFDGTRIAMQRADQRVEVEPIYERALPSITTRVGGFTQDYELYVGGRFLALLMGTSRQLWHVFDWQTGVLFHRYERTPSIEKLTLLSPKRKAELTKLSAYHYSDVKLQDPERYRMPQCRQEGLCFLPDRFGQIAVLNEEEQLIAMFVAFRDRAAAWLPDGTRWGSLTLSAGPASSDAPRKIAEVLMQAEMVKTR